MGNSPKLFSLTLVLLLCAWRVTRLSMCSQLIKSFLSWMQGIVLLHSYSHKSRSPTNSRRKPKYLYRIYPSITMISPPSEFVCPLTKELMSEPMVTRYGVRFERKAILDWLDQGNAFCPVTKNPLRISNLLSDKTLQWKIGNWKENNDGEVAPEPSTDNDDGDQRVVVVMATAAVPQARFLCPITRDIIKEPMMAKSGYNFEKSAILAKFENCNQILCPVSGKPLEMSDLVSNHKLQWEIKQWQLKYGEAYDEKTQLEMDFKLLSMKKAEESCKETANAVLLKALTEQEDDVTAVISGDESDPNMLAFLEEVIGTIEAAE